MLVDYLEKNNKLEVDLTTKVTIRKLAYDKVETRFKIESSEEFVLSMNADEWKYTEPYDSKEIENIIECLYRFVELNTTLEQIMKAFDSESRVISTSFQTICEFVNQDVSKTYATSRNKEKMLTPEELKETDADNKKKRRPTMKQNNNNNIADGSGNSIFWFIDEQTYLDLGERVLRLVGLINQNEKYENETYTPQLIYDRIREIEVNTAEGGELGSNKLEIENGIHARRLAVLKERLLEVFVCTMYPEFEYELRYYSTTTRRSLQPMLSAFYLDKIVIHHHHYFPDMDPLGLAHQVCNLKTYMRGVPKPHIYCHNLTNFDSYFILKMIPNYVMAHKGKNTTSP